MMEPHDHLPKSVRDDDRAKCEAEIQHRKALYRQANRVRGWLHRVCTGDGPLTRAEATILS